jgi:hypothetical protein
MSPRLPSFGAINQLSALHKSCVCVFAAPWVKGRFPGIAAVNMLRRGRRLPAPFQYLPSEGTPAASNDRYPALLQMQGRKRSGPLSAREGARNDSGIS